MADEGVAIALSACVICEQVCTYNPLHVPSLIVKGVREPIGECCIEAVQVELERLGRSRIDVHPEAYKGCHPADLSG